ncbi:uncharacterized protein KIAA2013 homolog [Mya arenaria]|uniref:uncharacterized protein KIAA2013 homolog n=1 Tax=Mya arenaria TaxID=6604 RepID=UPI0022E24C23|nr:uncharacterized protein KIAA2013 homolog [Mya arenaria]
MNNCLYNFYRCLVCKPSKFRNMWWKTAISSSMTRVNSLSRSRKVILALFVVLVFLYYIGPRIFGYGTKKHVIHANVGKCLAAKLSRFQDNIDNFDAMTNYVPQVLAQKNYPTYVGNGYLAVSFDSQNGLYIRLNRALSLPVPYYPVVNSYIDNTSKEEVDVLQIRDGIANRIQIFNTRSGCITAESEMYAHRSRPSLLVQDLRLHNPTRSEVALGLDQILASGWKDAKTSSESAVNTIGTSVSYTLTWGLIKIDALAEDLLYVGVAIASTNIKDKTLVLEASKFEKIQILTTIQYTKAGPLDTVQGQMTDLQNACKQELEAALKIDSETLRSEHVGIWRKLWQSGFSISYSLAADALNGDKINSTIYYVLSNVPAPLHDPKTNPEVALDLKKTLHYPDQCYKEHTSLHSGTLWADAYDEDSIARIVTTWIITLEKQGCLRMISAGVEGVLQAMLLSIGSLHFGDDHLEMRLHPKDTHRDFNFHRINYGNNTHMNISVLVGENNKANIFVSLDRNDKPYYACDAGCLDPPVPLSNSFSKFPVKLTEPLTAILYVTADKIHMEELKHAIHVKEIAEAPAHEHHVIALHKHGHHFGGLPTIFWVSIAFLITVFHLFLFKLIYNEYCQAQDRYSRSRYNL